MGLKLRALSFNTQVLEVEDMKIKRLCVSLRFFVLCLAVFFFVWLGFPIALGDGRLLAK